MTVEIGSCAVPPAPRLTTHQLRELVTALASGLENNIESRHCTASAKLWDSADGYEFKLELDAYHLRDKGQYRVTLGRIEVKESDGILSQRFNMRGPKYVPIISMPCARYNKRQPMALFDQAIDILDRDLSLILVAAGAVAGD